MKKWFKGLAKKIKHDNENGARKAVLEDMFYDFNRSRVEIYKMNFARGIFFGVGSALGATVVIAILAWLLSLFTDLPGGIGNFIQSIIDSMSKSH